MLDLITRVLLLLLFMLAFIVIYYVFKKLIGVDLKDMQQDVKDIKAVVFTPIDKKNATEELENCHECCSNCRESERCAGNKECCDCLKLNLTRGANYNCCTTCEDKDSCTQPNSRCAVCHNVINTKKDNKNNDNRF